MLTHEAAQHGLVVTSGLFSQEAKKFAENKPLNLINGEKLLELLSKLPRDDRGTPTRYRISKLEELITSEQCPRCSTRLIRKTGKRGLFLSCERFPDCKFSVDV